MKSCIVCGEEKSLDQYHKKASNKDGLDNRCAPCKNARRRERYKQNKEYEDARNRAWMDKNRKYFRAYNKEYYEKNKDDYSARTAKRKARLLNATPVWADERYLKDLYVNCREAEIIFKDIDVKFNVDHIVPLKGKLVCGLHTEDNLQILTASENFRKNNVYDC